MACLFVKPRHYKVMSGVKAFVCKSNNGMHKERCRFQDKLATNNRFLYVAVFGGNLLVIYRQDSTRSVLSTGQFVSDGQLHRVQLDMLTSRVSMQVDGVHFEESSATLSQPYLAYSSTAILSLGGVAVDVTLPPECPVKESLVGGITITAINGLFDQLSFSNVRGSKDLSLAGVPAPPSNAPEPPISDTTTPLDTCPAAPVPALLPMSQGFVLDGSQVVSWTELAPADSPVSYFEGSFQLGIGFAAYKADGVLVYLANSLNAPTDYFTVYFLDSTINVKMRSSLQEDITVSLTQRYVSAERYQLVIIRINDYVAVTVATENDFANSGKNSETASTLNIDFARNLYLGGVGLNELASSPLPTELKQADRSNFAGAIYSVTLSKDPDSNDFITFPINALDRSTAPAVPETARYGVSLAGGDVNSYLGLGTVATESSLTIEMSLTTSSSSGLIFLLYQTSPSLSYFALDIQDNQLRLHLPATFPSITSPAMLIVDDEANICDSQPHTLVITVEGGTVTTTVDGIVASRQTIPVSHGLQGMQAAQFFIAGLPGAKPETLPQALQSDSLSTCVLSVSRTFGAVSQTYDPTQFASSSEGVSYGCPY
ncbi:laminin subunit alpha-1-like [Plakobranchus ocellatus]|uniref:Laminin subunit alpha-1-like n=1 Tax=Plakobranchus ocellatus TaxID=259542 RepID=A0AAV4DCP5_9GAST|nr:laminin subunit alpha-1-like [Plakobranchus ocellatus]